MGPCPGPCFIASMRPWQGTATGQLGESNLMVILQGQAIGVLHSIPIDTRYDDIIETLEGRYRDHQLAVAYHSQLISDSLQDLLPLSSQSTRSLLGCITASSRGRQLMHLSSG